VLAKSHVLSWAVLSYAAVDRKWCGTYTLMDIKQSDYTENSVSTAREKQFFQHKDMLIVLE